MSVYTLPLSVFSDDEAGLVRHLLDLLQSYQPANKTKHDYYEGANRLRDLGIAIPPHLRSVETVVGWPGTAVDVLEERLDFESWVVPGDDGDGYGLREAFIANDLDVESGQAHLDALIYGTAFAVVGSGAEGEPHPLITVESPTSMTAIYDRRSRRLSAALSALTDETGEAEQVTLYLPGETVIAGRRGGGLWVIEDRDRHQLGRVPVARLINRPRSGKLEGRSEISLAVRSYTDTAVRTMLGAEVAREFFAAPQRWVMGADESAFVGADGQPKSSWESYLGRVWAIGNDHDEAGNVTQPKVGQFPAASPEPFLAQVRTLAQLLAAECAIPASYLGFTTENPSSADAIRQAEARLIKRAERRQRQFGRAWTEVARLCLLVRDGAVPDEFAGVRPLWRDPSTPTRMAAAQEAVQLISAGVLLPDSSVTYDRVGLSETDQARLRADKDRAGGQERLQGILDRARQVRSADPSVERVVERREPLGDAG